jgi:hypothetical protein
MKKCATTTSAKANLSEFFQADFRLKNLLKCSQTLDFEGLKGRMLSSSYMPTENDSNFEPMIAELRRLFDKYAENGKIQILYNTNVFYSQF